MKWAWTLLFPALAAVVAACGGEDTHGGAPHGPPGHVGDAGAPVVRDVSDHHGVGVMRCERCHTPEDRNHPEWKAKAMAMGHDLARTFEDRTTCKCCHLGEVKGYGEPLDRKCAECHEDIRVTITAMGKMHCLSCHDPTASAGMAIRESAWECKKCHAEDQGDKPAIDVHAGEDCSNCHRPHQEPWTVQRACTDCHVGHETWHDPKRDAGAGAAPSKHGIGAGPTPLTGEPTACAVCHKPHEVSGAASGRCFACHAQREPQTFTAAATFAGGHEACTTCHAPHGESAKTPARECRSCHTTIATMAGRGAEPHSKCVSCHKPHDVRGSVKSSCMGCHLSVTPEHPDPKGDSCIGCHDPHPGERPRALTPAQAAVAARAPGAKPTIAFPTAPSPVQCQRCHTKATDEFSFHDGKTACKSCHTPHKFTAASAPACGNCHAKQVAAAAMAAGHDGGRPPMPPGPAGHGHADCKACHQPHAPKAQKPACATCHTVEAQTAPAGHADCLRCHSAHPESRAPKAQCTSCHAQKKTGPHGPVACTSCHRPHGPDAPTGPAGPASRPDCLSCHTQAKLGGLHVASGHGTCTSCHSAHKPPSAERATCLACHEKKRDHEPSALVCSGCHPFTKGR